MLWTLEDKSALSYIADADGSLNEQVLWILFSFPCSFASLFDIFILAYFAYVTKKYTMQEYWDMLLNLKQLEKKLKYLK